MIAADVQGSSSVTSSACRKPSENLTPAAPLRLPLSGHRAPLPPGEAGRGGRAMPRACGYKFTPVFAGDFV